MKQEITVRTDVPSLYGEPDSLIYRFKRRLTYLFAFRLLRIFVDRQAKLEILEVGSGSGFFLDFSRDFFPNSSLTALEYDERLLAESKRRAPDAIIHQGNAECFYLGYGKYDLIVSFQVIEHLYKPEAMLSNVKAHLKPGGIFLVSTPNLSSLGASIMKAKWHGFRDDHVSLKNRKDWDTLISLHGFINLYSGTTFFSGIPILNTFPLGIINWILLIVFGSIRWSSGESYVGVFKSKASDK